MDISCERLVDFHNRMEEMNKICKIYAYIYICLYNAYIRDLSHGLMPYDNCSVLKKASFRAVELSIIGCLLQAPFFGENNHKHFMGHNGFYEENFNNHIKLTSG